MSRFVDRCLFFCHFSFGHCIVCPSSIYGFWLPLWCLQAFPVNTPPLVVRLYHTSKTNGLQVYYQLSQKYAYRRQLCHLLVYALLTYCSFVFMPYRFIQLYLLYLIVNFIIHHKPNLVLYNTTNSKF